MDIEDLFRFIRGQRSIGHEAPRYPPSIQVHRKVKFSRRDNSSLAKGLQVNLIVIEKIFSVLFITFIKSKLGSDQRSTRNGDLEVEFIYSLTTVMECQVITNIPYKGNKYDHTINF